MRFALILIYVFFISATGQTAQTAISDSVLYDNIISLYGWDNPEIFYDDCRNTKQTAIDSPSVTANGYLFDDCLFNTQSEKAFLTYDHGGIKQLDYFDDKWTKFASTGYHSMYAKAEISAIDSGRNGESADNPNPGRSYYDEVISWMGDAYHAWVVKDHYGSTRLLLLSFGVVGLIGIRRNFKKS